VAIETIPSREMWGGKSRAVKANSGEAFVFIFLSSLVRSKRNRDSQICIVGLISFWFKKLHLQRKSARKSNSIPTILSHTRAQKKNSAACADNAKIAKRLSDAYYLPPSTSSFA
jgi:hypothetical protein